MPKYFLLKHVAHTNASYSFYCDIVGAFADSDREWSGCHGSIPNDATTVKIPCVADNLEDANSSLWEKCLEIGICMPMRDVAGNASERGYSFLVETMANYTCNSTGLPPKLEAFDEAWSNTLVLQRMTASFTGVYRCSAGSTTSKVTHQYILELKDFSCKTCFQEKSNNIAL